ncbi:hypothetical protein [Vibrio parahaemolyticus]|uniref:hypothetical protein n=1 Tax=Vibrio parahaemolyticus TaxID=670 RepID=UPI003D8142C6
MAKKRIAILTLSSGEPRLMLAGVDNGQLFIIQCDRLERSMMSLKLTLPDKLKKLKDKGFVVLVDEILPYFYKYGRAVRLSDLDASGRPIIVAAMEAYNNLHALGGITYPRDAGGRFEVSPSVVDEVRGTDGKAVYNIDWNELQPDTFALMFAVYAATQDNLLDRSSLKQFFAQLNKPKEPEKPVQRLQRVFTRKDEMIADGKYRHGGEME